MSQESNSQEQGVAIIAAICTMNLIIGSVYSLRQEFSDSEFVKAKVVMTKEEYIGPDDNENDKRTITVESDKAIKVLRLYRNLIGSTQDLNQTWQTLQNSSGKCFDFELKNFDNEPVLIKKITATECPKDIK